MAKYDVHRASDGAMLLDCQSDMLTHLSTRLVVPLVSPGDGIQIDNRLTPLLDVAGSEMLMLTHLASAVPANALGRPVATVANQEYVVSNALDVLITGF
ncbi:MAG: plasmid maintenance protein CcdB [Sphingomonadales bacterium]|nr:MAG: plasmid maintenance protein CcdB [Sphingomonadales bacterium]